MVNSLYVLKFDVFFLSYNNFESFRKSSSYSEYAFKSAVLYWYLISFSYLNDSFLTRPSETEDFGGQFQPSRYFSGADASPFYGLSYVVNDRLLLKLERDTTLTDGMMQYDSPKFDYTYGFEYNFNKNFVLGFYHERGNYTSFKFTYKKNASSSSNVNTKYKKIERQDNTSSVDYLINALKPFA